MTRFRTAPALFVTLILIGCTAETPGTQGNTASFGNNSVDAITIIDEPENAAALPPGSGDILTPAGLGALRIGMSRAEVVAAMGEASGGADPDTEACEQMRPARAPEGVLVMLEQGKVTRISLIRDAAIKTDAGIGLGATPAQVTAAYGDRAKFTPHKYMGAPAGYVTVWTQGSGGPGSLGIVYEVGDKGRVTMIHSGGPAIQYVEGCA